MPELTTSPAPVLASVPVPEREKLLAGFDTLRDGLAEWSDRAPAWPPFDEVRRLRAGLPPHVLLVIDAAYAEYVRRNDYEAGIELVATTENTVMCRTFSKIYGLAALRLGWLYGPPEVLDALNRIRAPFNVASPAIEAGIAALEDTDHIERSRAVEGCAVRDVTEPHGIEVVQRARFAVRIPPARGEAVEFRGFRRAHVRR